jgi:UDP-N-acetylmuramoylalanine--D-glutamate ligase
MESKVVQSKVISASQEHQLEAVREIDGVIYVNDSKSINVKSTVNSINSINHELILLIGGEDRTSDYGALLNADLKKIKAIIYLGKDSERIMAVAGRMALLFATSGNIEEATMLAKTVAKMNQVILFSPACPSFDVFDNYKNRGNKFKAIVESL